MSNDAFGNEWGQQCWWRRKHSNICTPSRLNCHHIDHVQYRLLFWIESFHSFYHVVNGSLKRFNQPYVNWARNATWFPISFSSLAFYFIKRFIFTTLAYIDYAHPHIHVLEYWTHITLLLLSPSRFGFLFLSHSLLLKSSVA